MCGLSCVCAFGHFGRTRWVIMKLIYNNSCAYSAFALATSAITASQ